ncbi:MAG TPA: glycosyltransferase [Alphaproteobacteria bacterium]|nr:glycosyltransferase [Alphaproteobacteria bacterium]
MTILAVLALAAWIVQLTLRGGFWRADVRLERDKPGFGPWPKVIAVIPARNEASIIRRSVASLLGQDYPGRLSLIVVDDRSDDDTAEEARRTAAELGAEDRLVVMAGAPLPEGWTGKLWAVEQGVRRAATRAEPTFLLLTDADISHDERSLRRLVAKAESDKVDLVSLMVLLRCRSGWERLLIPAFVFFFQMLYPFPLVNRPGSRVAAAAGGCMLVRRAALERAGGIAAIRSAIIDDCALARMIKSQGGRLWLGLTEEVRSLRPYDSLETIWGMVARSAYAQLKYSPLLLIGTVLGMVLIFLAPPLLAILGCLAGKPVLAAPALLAWLAMAVAYRPTLKLYRRSALLAPLLPVAATLYTAMTVDSARRHWRGKGGAWKGRTYSRDLRPSG